MADRRVKVAETANVVADVVSVVLNVEVGVATSAAVIARSEAEIVLSAVQIVPTNASNALSVRVSKAVNRVKVIAKAVEANVVAEGVVVAVIAQIAPHVKMLSKAEHLAQIPCRLMSKMACKARAASHAHHAKADDVNVANAVAAIALTVQTVQIYASAPLTVQTPLQRLWLVV